MASSSAVSIGSTTASPLGSGRRNVSCFLGLVGWAEPAGLESTRYPKPTTKAITPSVQRKEPKRLRLCLRRGVRQVMTDIRLTISFLYKSVRVSSHIRESSPRFLQTYTQPSVARPSPRACTTQAELLIPKGEYWAVAQTPSDIPSSTAASTLTTASAGWNSSGEEGLPQRRSDAGMETGQPTVILKQAVHRTADGADCADEEAKRLESEPVRR